jgi:5-methylcytosine-specific restriction protein A
MGVSAEEFAKALAKRMREATSLGHDHIDVNAGDLHREVGVYPKPGHRMPTCCAAMRAGMGAGDVVLDEPPKGSGASLTIRYQLPRP